jgi:Polyketide cyclase / dehydrase and lipid transport
VSIISMASVNAAPAGSLMGQIHVERTIAASPVRVFDWLLDPANLTVSPLFRKAAWAKGSSGPAAGAVRELTGIGFWAHEQITDYDAPRSCSYIVVESFPPSKHDGGTLTCIPSADGTHVDWVSGYSLPARAGGKLIEVLTLPLIRSLTFRTILVGCAKALEI